MDLCLYTIESQKVTIYCQLLKKKVETIWKDLLWIFNMYCDANQSH